MNSTVGIESRLFKMKVLLIVASAAMAVVLQYLSLSYFSEFHDLLRHVYYLPIILGAYFYGKTGSIIVSVLVCILFI